MGTAPSGDWKLLGARNSTLFLLGGGAVGQWLGGGGWGDSAPLLDLFVITFDWVIQFCWNHSTLSKIYMEWIFRKKHFAIARIYGPGANFSTGGSIKILPNFKFPQIYMYYISLDCKLFGNNKYRTCIQHAKSSIKTILSKRFEQNVDYAKID